jgi:hypothetical protein
MRGESWETAQFLEHFDLDNCRKTEGFPASIFCKWTAGKAVSMAPSQTKSQGVNTLLHK